MKSNTQIDLGLAISRLRMKPGQRRTQHEIACYCDCSVAYIYLTELKALQKIRRRLRGISAEDIRHFLKP